MSKRKSVSKPIKSNLPAGAEGFDSLAELALDMRSSWNHATDEVWQKLDPALWERTHNPWVVLQTISRDQIEKILADPAFRKNVDILVTTRRKAVKSPAWFQQHHPQSPLTCVAYFCMEFMLSESLRISSGGLGNVAGDQLKASSDLGVPVISGGDWPQFKKQLLSNLPHDEHLNNLLLLPTCGTKFYKYSGDWKKIYSEDFTADERKEIISSLNKAIGETGFKVEKVWGEVIEDRGSQITFSALGQQAPIEEKKKWDPDFTKRKKIKALLDTFIPEFSVRLGGTTSVDVTKPGIDKAYGIRKFRDILGIAIHEMIYVGDALFPGGNDYPAQEAGAVSIRVRDPNETKRVVEAIIACLDHKRQA